MDEWRPVVSAPRGIEVKVKHELAIVPSTAATGILRDGKWVCSQAFIDPDTMAVYWVPTHWALLHQPVDW